MEKFTLFDFMAFVVPGSTVVIVLYILFGQYIPDDCFFVKLDVTIFILPFLFFSLIVGHLMSWIGTSVDKIVDNCKLIYRCELSIMLRSETFNTAHIKGFEKLVEDLTNEKAVYNKKEEQEQNKQARHFYERIEQFLEIQEKNKLPVILQSQYAFFRNSMATCVILGLLFIVAYIVKYENLCITIQQTFFYLSSSFLLFIGAFFCYRRMLYRKKCMNKYTYLNYWALMVVKKTDN